MKKMMHAFKGKSFMKGTNAVVISLVMVAVLVLLNLVAIKLDLKADLTKGGAFSLSKETVKYLNELKDPVQVTMIFPQLDSQNPSIEQVRELLGKFAQKSKNIKLETLDPSKNPMVVERYKKYNLQDYSVVVEKNGKGKLLAVSELFTSTEQSQQSVAEQKLLSALLSLQGGKTFKAYLVEGHGESVQVGGQVTTLLKDENYDVVKFNLLAEEIPQDAECLILVAPIKDYTSAELVKLDNYFKTGKPMVAMFAPSESKQPNLQAYFKEWGIAVEDNLVLEGDRSRTAGSPVVLIPEMKENDITKYFVKNNLNVFYPYTRSITMDAEVGKGIQIDPLLQSTSKSFGRTDFKSNSPQKIASDKNGPFTLAVSVTRPYESKTAKLLVFGSVSFVDAQAIMQNSTNKELFVNGVNWATGQEKQVNIMPKDLTQEQLKLDDLTAMILGWLVVILIPLAVVIWSVVVWLRRRHL